jgi:hypothetical protein
VKVGYGKKSLLGAGSMALSDTAIRGLRLSKKLFKVYDRDGLFLLVNPSGSKLWRWRYLFDGKEN